MATSQTIHFQGTFKNKAGGYVVPYCTRFASRPKSGVVTENKDEVNCTRCAKQLDIVPAAKKVSSTAGTCQCCFGSYETRQKAGKGEFRSVLHGYTRPGHGYITGECRGVGYVPYEVSCEQTKVFRQELVDLLAEKNEYLNKLVKYEVPSLSTQVGTGEMVESARHYGMKTEKKVSIRVPVTQREDFPNPYKLDQPWEKVFGYDYLRTLAIYEVERHIQAIESDIKFLTGKIETWAPVAFPIEK